MIQTEVDTSGSYEDNLAHLRSLHAANMANTSKTTASNLRGGAFLKLLTTDAEWQEYAACQGLAEPAYPPEHLPTIAISKTGSGDVIYLSAADVEQASELIGRVK